MDDSTVHDCKLINNFQLLLLGGIWMRVVKFLPYVFVMGVLIGFWGYVAVYL